MINKIIGLMISKLAYQTMGSLSYAIILNTKWYLVNTKVHHKLVKLLIKLLS